MGERTVIIWAVLAFIGLFVFMWLVKRKRRKLGKYVAVHKFVLLLVAAGFGLLTYWYAGDSPHLIWVSRLVLFLLGGLNLWALYSQDWTKREVYEYENDSFLTEGLIMLVQGLIASIAFTMVPQALRVIDPSADLSAMLWDGPLLFYMPFLLFKLGDVSSQIPFRVVENSWVFPLEPVNPENWPWRNLMQVNFQMKKSLLEEYNLFYQPANPWIEAPKEAVLGDIFRLVMLERRRRPELITLQDMGDEYGGEAKFWWLFSVKIVWWNPSTWFRKKRYLNPSLTITENRLQKNDIVRVRRIPGSGAESFLNKYRDQSDGDPDKTVLIRR